jgi:hypothetical protein
MDRTVQNDYSTGRALNYEGKEANDGTRDYDCGYVR